ncbi:MAG: hypothetical protein HY721_08560 [Planctomycetes bacterium]|nr:hypothetical protein [Planctomycetota bacterium]
MNAVRAKGAAFAALVSMLLFGLSPLPAASVYVEKASTWRYLPGLGEASDPPSAWRLPEFDDSAWASGAAPFGYGDPPFGTDLSLLSPPMQGNYTCLFLRQVFQPPFAQCKAQLSANADYDDGFILWINGVEALRVNMPGAAGDPVPFNATAAPHESGAYATFLLPEAADSLVPGRNVIAIQAFNRSLSQQNDNDFKIDLELVDGRPDADLHLVFLSENLSEYPGHQIVGDPFATGAPPGLAPEEMVVPPGKTTLYAAILSRLSGQGVGGVAAWSIAVGTDFFCSDVFCVDVAPPNTLRISDATTIETAGALPPYGGIRALNGFERTEITVIREDEDSFCTSIVAVSGVVLSSSSIITLAPDSTAVVLALTVEGVNGDSGRIHLRDGFRCLGVGLVKSVLPLKNAATIVKNAESRQLFECYPGVNITFRVPPPGSFHRGDPNDSGTVDISDGVTIFGFLFLGNPGALSCNESADANNDGKVDISDGIYLLSWLFTGGPPPAAPGPTGLPCGLDPDPPGSPEDLGCGGYAHCS